MIHPIVCVWPSSAMVEVLKTKECVEAVCSNAEDRILEIVKTLNLKWKETSDVYTCEHHPKSQNGIQICVTDSSLKWNS